MSCRIGILQRLISIYRWLVGINAEPKTALRLSKVLGTSAEFWMNMQTNYDMAVAKKQVDLSGIEPVCAA